jgi:hypothetical protein
MLEQGTFSCSVCGKAEPHYHDPAEAELERYGRPEFEDWLDQATGPPIGGRSNPYYEYHIVNYAGIRSRWTRRNYEGRYIEPKVEAHWQIWAAAWMAQDRRWQAVLKIDDVK